MNEFLLRSISWDKLTQEADKLFKDLFPICRSLTGEGVRKTLERLNEIVRFDIKEIPSGTVCYDWTVPDEWNIKGGYIKDSKGNKIVDFSDNNLHVVSYSVSVDKTISFQELEEHIHYLPKLPDAIPYRTTYYNKNWGFCLTYNQYKQLDRNEEYHVYIDSSLSRGTLTYGEALLKGDSGQEYLVSTYCCHPSMANDNLSGLILWAFLIRELESVGTRHSYRFVIVPETIGAIAYLSQNEEAMQGITGGLIPTTVAGPGRFGYKHTFIGDHLIDRVVSRTFKELNISHVSYPFDVNGSDESHYSAPYFRIPIGTICKDKYYAYDYYHTSLDNLDFVSAEDLVKTLKLYLLTIEKLEINLTYKSNNPYCEPMLGKRNLYPSIGGHIHQKSYREKDKNDETIQYRTSSNDMICENELDLIGWLMFYCDGKTSLLDIAEKAKLPMKQLYKTAEKLKDHKLLERLHT